ncbi:MAG: hypothetical protein ABSD31_07350 [Candidatus Binataceae bacterium]
MRVLSAVLIAVIAGLLMGAPVHAQAPGTCAGMSVGQLTNLNGFVPFQQTDSLWNTDISSAPVDPNSANIINFIGSSVTLHPDFGSGKYASQSIGIPYQVVAGSQAKVRIIFTAYGDESDPGPMPIPGNALIEGYPKPGNGDRHVLVLEKDGCWLYELYNSHLQKNGSWKAGSAAVWDLTIDEQRPYSWTSADAAGLPIFAGLARYDEVAAGTISHALRFTVPTTQQAFVAPASHWASSNTNPSAPPMGTRLRLNASFDTSGFSPENQVILTALKHYGMILADNGSGIFISGAPDSRWNNSDLGNLKTITASNFEVVSMGTVYTPSNLPTGAAPDIVNFSATPATASAGEAVTLSWNVSYSEYNIISPTVGAVRGTSVVVTPSATTTYTLYSTNAYGRTTSKVTVTVR